MDRSAGRAGRDERPRVPVRLVVPPMEIRDAEDAGRYVIGKTSFEAVVDTGATESFITTSALQTISKDVISRHRWVPEDVSPSYTLTSAFFSDHYLAALAVEDERGRLYAPRFTGMTDLRDHSLRVPREPSAHELDRFVERIWSRMTAKERRRIPRREVMKREAERFSVREESRTARCLLGSNVLRRFGAVVRLDYLHAQWHFNLDADRWVRLAAPSR